MPRYYSTTKNKHSKINFQEYLRSLDEPRDWISNDTPPALEAELLENAQPMRKRFRDVARYIRNH